MPDPLPLLKIRNLNVVFSSDLERVEAVKAVNFDLRHGEILAIVGESGSGKSTLAMAIMRLLPMNAQIQGHIHYANTDLMSLEMKKLALWRGRHIATIFQDPASTLDPVFSIGFQFDEVLCALEPNLSKKQRYARALELLNFVGIAEAGKRLKHFPHQFSGGQLQRIMIAMALAGRPQILIADEPTTALDVTVQQEILDLLYRLNHEEKMTILLITHDMGVVADMADRVIVMKEGCIVETANVEIFFKSPQDAYSQRLLSAVPHRQKEKDGAGGSPQHTKALPEKCKLSFGQEVLSKQEAEALEQSKNHSLRNAAIILQADQLCLRYTSRFGHGRDIVHNVSFDLRRGEFVGLVGESGSGKTTIGRSLLGIIAPSSGRLMLDGEALYANKHHAKRQRARIGAVFQNPIGSLNPHLTVGQSIAEPLSTHAKLSRTDKLNRIAQLLEHVGLPASWAMRYPSELSGGQCQRVAIARALALNPLLLVVDEPTSALDVSIQADILELLRNLQAQYAFSCLFISHDLAVVRHLCQSVLVLHKGEIIERGDTNTVFDMPHSDYTQQLIASAPLPDPHIQASRRQHRLRML